MATTAEWITGKLNDGTPLPIDKVNRFRQRRNLLPIEGTDSNVVESHTAPLPPLLIRGLNFAAAMARWAGSGFPIRSQQQIDERLAICQACPNLQQNHCSLCGCACVENQQLMNKLAIATEKCPIGKWQ